MTLDIEIYEAHPDLLQTVWADCLREFALSAVTCAEPATVWVQCGEHRFHVLLLDALCMPEAALATALSSGVCPTAAFLANGDRVMCFQLIQGINSPLPLVCLSPTPQDFGAALRSLSRGLSFGTQFAGAALERAPSPQQRFAAAVAEATGVPAAVVGDELATCGGAARWWQRVRLFPEHPFTCVARVDSYLE